MKAIQFLIGFALLALASSLASAYDPNRLQDICVAVEDPKNGVFVNGKFCKDPTNATAEDFFLSGLNKPGNTTNRLNVSETEANVEQIPGLNTLGVSAFRTDFELNGQSPPHIHPRASEILLVLKGTLYAGFVTSDNLNHKLIAKVLNEGDVFVFPIGLIHFLVNVGNTSAVAYSGLNSQFPGEITIANTIFGAHPLINATYLAQAFQLDEQVVIELEKKFG